MPRFLLGAAGVGGVVDRLAFLHVRLGGAPLLVSCVTSCVRSCGGGWVKLQGLNCLMGGSFVVGWQGLNCLMVSRLCGGWAGVKLSNGW